MGGGLVGMVPGMGALVAPGVMAGGLFVAVDSFMGELLLHPASNPAATRAAESEMIRFIKLMVHLVFYRDVVDDVPDARNLFGNVGCA